MRIETFIADALGDASHILVDGQSAAVIDPQRDIRPYLAAAERAGATIEFVFETHVHNDYISGGCELAELGARIVVPAAANLKYPHLGLEDGKEVQVGGTRLRAMAAPGHTYEHTIYLAAGNGSPEAAFTGGSLLMGAAGRSDLLGPDHAEALARAQWDSIHKLASELSPASMIYPTHGSGSFCAASGSIMDRYGALKTEQGRNPALSLASFELFRDRHLQPAPTPSYYRHMAPINREGPKVYGTPPSPRRLDAAQAIDLMGTGAAVVDIRDARSHAAGYLEGSINIQHSSSFVAYVGWFVPFNAPIVLIAGNEGQADIATIDLFRIGYEQVQGVLLARDIPADRRSSFEPVSVDETQQALESGDRPVIDVRFKHEQEAAPLPGVIGAPVEHLRDHIEKLPADAIVVCEAGYRASIAASVLRSHGLRAVPTLGQGVTELQRRLSVRT